VKRTEKLIKKLFKNEKNEPLQLTPTQQKIFDLIFFKKHPYNLIIAFTRYGKSFVTALAVLARCIFYPEKWAIVAPTEKHAKIILGYVIDHIFDHEFIVSKLQLEEGETLERLRRERSKRRITFKIFGQNKYSEIFILSAHSEKENPMKSLLGFGAQNVVLDESSLISDETYAGVLRMLGDSKEPFLVELGNPLKRNHFWQAFNDPKFNKMVIDYKVGLEEGRITKEQVELMRGKPFFDVLYECKFPTESEILKKEDIIFQKVDLKEIDLFAIGTDLAISEKETADETAIVVAGKIRGTDKIAILNAISGHFTMNETLNIVKTFDQLYSKLGTVLVGVEDVGYQRAFAEELKRRFLVSPILIKRSKDKRSRVLMLSPYFQNRQIIFEEGKEKFEKLISQITNFGVEENDDLVDAFEMAVSLLKDYLIKEEKTEEQLTYEEMRKREIAEAIKKHVSGESEQFEFKEDYEY
jgi:predicted phage terminase large subunit-like protein